MLAQSKAKAGSKRVCVLIVYLYLMFYSVVHPSTRYNVISTLLWLTGLEAFRLRRGGGGVTVGIILIGTALLRFTRKGFYSIYPLRFYRCPFIHMLYPSALYLYPEMVKPKAVGWGGGGGAMRGSWFLVTGGAHVMRTCSKWNPDGSEWDMCLWWHTTSHMSCRASPFLSQFFFYLVLGEGTP